MRKIILTCMLCLLPLTAWSAPRSLFFTSEELESIMQASKGAGPVDSKSADGKTDEPQVIDMGPREIKLSGLVYQGANDWTLWLNGQRVTPKNIPDRVMGLQVYPEYIKIRWMDVGTQRIINITLRPHQTYNLDLNTMKTGS